MRLPQTFRRRGGTTRVPALREPRPAAWWIAPAALVVVGTVYTVAWWLLAGLPTVPTPQQAAETAARSEIIRTALAAGAGVGAAITLMLAFRRQRHQEMSAHLTAYDATERRVTELYTKAAEQLGHDKAAVRLAGLYALERLAQDNPGHRQTIVNVICAYLRMPYTPPEPPDPEQARRQTLRDAARRYRAADRTTIGTAPVSPGADPENERQVRLTAQRILPDHLRDNRSPHERATTAPPEQFWHDIRIDLTGALLIDFDFAYCRTAQAVFHRATFFGDAKFLGATFFGGARFAGATFSMNANFGGATFIGTAGFGGVTFAGGARFAGANLGIAEFAGATFSMNANFAQADFSSGAGFVGTTFSGDAGFAQVTFNGGAEFAQATFSGGARFTGATFSMNADFGGATFSGGAEFGGATFFTDANFGGAAFKEGVDLAGAQVAQAPGAQLVWPAGWRVASGADGVRVLERKGEPPPAAETVPLEKPHD
ncbi:pentapeptide repeat-containing protein [Nonomuraea sp. NPDC050022]|uniref:pentapeptide repeat-containing protein n=1 Tax=Nonomuraea sp. NPDC050022 TaxID=3364358 RepID=UPI00379C4DBA